MLYIKNKNKFLKHIIIIPLLTLLSIPIFILDICVEIYHRISFPLYGMKYVKRKYFIKIFDRSKLKYLNFLQKLYCMYCGYGNGVIRYWVEIANLTEKYWCGIKHKKDDSFNSLEYQKDFAEYGNKEDFIKKYKTGN